MSEWQTSWAREADKVKELSENNAHLRAALVKAEAECSTWRQRAEEAEECIVWVKCDDPEHERCVAAERTVREQRKVIEAASKFREKHERFHPDHWCATNHSQGRCDSCDFCAALAALAPDPGLQQGEGKKDGL